MKMLPNFVSKETTKSESEVFDLIKNASGSEGYYCLHSLGIARHSRKEYAEADFVIIGPAGIFCLEVKGGEVKRNGGTWEIGWPGRSYTSSEGPFKQAQGTKWPLIDYIRKQTNIDLRKNAVTGWGVVFPNIVFDVQDPEWDSDVVYDQRDKNASFIEYIKRLNRYFLDKAKNSEYTPSPTMGPERVKQIVSCLRGDFDKIPSISGLIGDSKRDLIQLGSNQYQVLDYVLNKDNPRIICDGAAGTGKTLLAREAAMRIADEGGKVLFVCFNDNISNYLKREFSTLKRKQDVWSIYKMLGHFIKLGGKQESLKHARSEYTKEQLFLEIYPRIFEEAAANLVEDDLMPQYDALVIDEAQDILNAPMLECLELLLDGGFKNGRWALFLDSQIQAEVYGRMDTSTLDNLSSFGAAKIPLNKNYRNPKPIVQAMCNITNIPLPECVRNISSEVEYRVASDSKGAGKRISSIINELLDDGVSPSEISILSCRKREKSCLETGKPKLSAPIVWLDDTFDNVDEKSISASTVSAFKGLENEIIILTDLPDAVSLSDWERSMLYVGMTRARTKLFAIISNEFLSNHTVQ